MQLAFVLYKYFPFGGLQRDFMRIALECQQRGHKIRVYTLIWEGDMPPGFEVLGRRSRRSSITAATKSSPTG
jgi:UDP-glucose:(heptosyl)LPS alpha-1,3-glucosyltransferase